MDRSMPDPRAKWQDVNLRFANGEQLTDLAVLLCLRLASCASSRLPAFLISRGFAESTGRWTLEGDIYWRGAVRTPDYDPILLPAVPAMSLCQTYKVHSVPIDSEYGPVVSEEEANRLFRERILIAEHDRNVSYIKICDAWCRAIRDEYGNEVLTNDSFRVLRTLNGLLPDPFTHPLQSTIALGCTELLRSTLLPLINMQQLPENFYFGEDPMMAAFRIGFYCLLGGISLEKDELIRMCGTHETPNNRLNYLHLLQSLTCDVISHSNSAALIDHPHLWKTQPSACKPEDHFWWSHLVFFAIVASIHFTNDSRVALLRDNLSVWLGEHSTQSPMTLIRSLLAREGILRYGKASKRKIYSTASAAVALHYLQIQDFEMVFELLGDLSSSAHNNAPSVDPEFLACLAPTYTRAADAVGFHRKAIYHGTVLFDMLYRQTLNPESAGSLLMSIADAYIGRGMYERASATLLRASRLYGLSSRLSILIALRRSICRRRCMEDNEENAMHVLASSAELVSGLEIIDAPLKLECVSEILALIKSLSDRLGAQVVASHIIPFVAWTKVAADRTIRHDWRVVMLDEALHCQSPSAGIMLPKSPQQPFLVSGTNTEMELMTQFHLWFDRTKQSGLTGPGFEISSVYIPPEAAVPFLRDTAAGTQLFKLIADRARKSKRNVSTLVKQKCPKVACILLFLGRWDVIPTFIKNRQLHDSALPFLEKPSEFPNEDSTLWSRFKEAQWKFCPVTVSLDGQDHVLDSRAVISISGDQLVRIGGCSVVRKVFGSVNVKSQSEEIRQPRAFALKVIKACDAKRHYDSEMEAFRHLAAAQSRSSGLIEFFGGFRTESAFALLLEHADRGNFESYMHQVPPPEDDQHVFQVWEQLIYLASALQSLHSLHKSGRHVSHGWHHGIKPNNILVLSHSRRHAYSIRLKIADLGTSHFEEEPSGEGQIVDWDSRGTHIYAAPEYYWKFGSKYRDRMPVTQCADVWSLGCVYSEAAVWTNSGYSDLEKYRITRQHQTSEIPKFYEGACFHDGIGVLSCVERTNTDIEVNSASPMLTELIGMVKEMLRPSRTRLQTNEVEQRGWGILANYRSSKVPRGSESHIAGKSSNVKFKTSRFPEALPPGTKNETPHEDPLTAEECFAKILAALEEHDVELARNLHERFLAQVPSYQFRFKSLLIIYEQLSLMEKMKLVFAF